MSEKFDGASLAAKASEVQRVARALFHQGPDWVTFFCEVLGVNGVVRTVFPSQEHMTLFEATEEYIEIQQSLRQAAGCETFIRLRGQERVDSDPLGSHVPGGGCRPEAGHPWLDWRRSLPNALSGLVRSETRWRWQVTLLV